MIIDYTEFADDIIPVDPESIQTRRHINDLSEHIAIDGSLVAQQQTLMLNEDIFFHIAPGEGQIPMSLVFDRHAEELSFPAIYLGQFRVFRDDITVTSCMMATSELRRFDRRGVTPSLKIV